MVASLNQQRDIDFCQGFRKRSKILQPEIDLQSRIVMFDPLIGCNEEHGHDTVGGVGAGVCERGVVFESQIATEPNQVFHINFLTKICTIASGRWEPALRMNS